jgi:hypothetical protein
MKKNNGVYVLMMVAVTPASTLRAPPCNDRREPGNSEGVPQHPRFPLQNVTLGKVDFDEDSTLHAPGSHKGFPSAIQVGTNRLVIKY